MRHRSAGFGIGLTTLDRLQDVQMVLDIIQAAVVGQPIKKLSDGLLRLQLAVSRMRDLEVSIRRIAKLGYLVREH